jgi:hypothetical protein
LETATPKSSIQTYYKLSNVSKYKFKKDQQYDQQYDLRHINGNPGSNLGGARHWPENSQDGIENLIEKIKCLQVVTREPVLVGGKFGI